MSEEKEDIKDIEEKKDERLRSLSIKKGGHGRISDKGKESILESANEKED